ncbi:hypothetical protein N7513_003338 [Penicillium frequentans]|uniref:Myb-like domain-containing protein n=1 Tax=Penicillium frequentans TaxID=3151616 RepID=A0AAD6CHP0_9EURO|nr:hypothetical protein N7494_013147 [Penicillium glabrum]KAJ5557752.1 hypothetical protein N7513_003338 [Penicillium glabrum]
MSVTLDNIQFYHGPSKPTKQPYLTFDSKRDSSGVDPSVPPSTTANQTSLATGHSGSYQIPHSEAILNRHAAQTSNLFDLEIAKTWEMVSSPPMLDNIGERGTRPLGMNSKYHDQEHPRSPSSALCKAIEPESSDRSSGSSRSSRSSSISISPPILDTHSSGLPLSNSSNMTRELLPSNSPNNREFFHICTPRDEVCSSSSASSISLQSGLTSKLASERSKPAFTPERGPGDNRAVAPRPIPESSLWHISVPGSAEPVSIQHAGMSDLEYVEQAASSGSASSDSATTSVQNHIPRIRKPIKEIKQPRSVRRDIAADRRHASVAVVIPSPRQYHLRGQRSPPEHLSSDHSSANDDGSDDDDFPTDTVASQASDVETHHLPLGESSRSICTSPCYTGHTPHSQPSGQHVGKDMTGRAILTIETLGSVPTYFLTFMPDTDGWIPHVPTHRPRAPKGPTKIGKRVARGGSTPVKGQRRSYSTDEDILLVKLKEEKNLSWEEITRHFPGRKSSSLQVHYFSKLKPQEPNRRGGQRQRRARRGRHT